MISIIIASRDIHQLNQIKQNILETIGVDFEVISYNNSIDGKGICQIYNKCATQAKYNNLVFCHDDIIFHTVGWGVKLLNLLKHKSVGLVGMVGSVFKASAPTSWVSIPDEHYRSALSNFSRTNSTNSSTLHFFHEVAVVDGLFLGLRRSIWNKFRFNEELNDFHLYDIDLSYRIFQSNLKVVVPRQFYVEHRSEGSFDKNWLNQSIQWHLKKDLPVFLPSVPLELINELEAYAYIVYLNQLIKFNMLKDRWLSIFIKITFLKKEIHFGLFKKVIQSFYASTKK